MVVSPRVCLVGQATAQCGLRGQWCPKPAGARLWALGPRKPGASFKPVLLELTRWLSWGCRKFPSFSCHPWFGRDFLSKL